MQLNNQELLGFWATLFSVGAGVTKKMVGRNVDMYKNKHFAKLVRDAEKKRLKAEEKKARAMALAPKSSGSDLILPLAIGGGALLLLMAKD